MRAPPNLRDQWRQTRTAGTARRHRPPMCPCMVAVLMYRGTSPIRRRTPQGPYRMCFSGGLSQKVHRSRTFRKNGRVPVRKFNNMFFSKTPRSYQTYERGTLHVNWGCESQTKQTTARFMARAHSESASRQSLCFLKPHALPRPKPPFAIHNVFPTSMLTWFDESGVAACIYSCS